VKKITGILCRVCAVGMLVGAVSHAQTDPRQESNTAAARKRIAEIVSQRLHDGESTINGIRIQTRTPPSSEVVNEIRRFGDSGAVILADYLHSKTLRERMVAVELLGLLGGARIVAPLRDVIRRDPSTAVRELALRWLTQAPPDLAHPIIEEAARTDPDERVRAVAKGILQPGGEDELKNSVPFKKQPPRF
jgi:HEAT repeats